jgi:hypothetical protein
VCDLPVRGVVLFADYMNKRYQCAKFSIPVSIQHQSSWIFCIHMNVDFTVLHPEHHFIHTAVAHVLHSLVGRNQSPSKINTHVETWSDKELCNADTAADIPLQQPYHSQCRNCI